MSGCNRWEEDEIKTQNTGKITTNDDCPNCPGKLVAVVHYEEEHAVPILRGWYCPACKFWKPEEA